MNLGWEVEVEVELEVGVEVEVWGGGVAGNNLSFTPGDSLISHFSA